MMQHAVLCLFMRWALLVCSYIVPCYYGGQTCLLSSFLLIRIRYICEVLNGVLVDVFHESSDG